MSKEQYVKLDEVTEILADVLCIPEFQSRNILESDVSEAYEKIISLERKNIPSADIMECARAIKEYCENCVACNGCPFWNDNSDSPCILDRPLWWDLPEGEKE